LVINNIPAGGLLNGCIIDDLPVDPASDLPL